MRKMILAATVLAVAIPAAPALAKPNHTEQEFRKDVSWAEREYAEDMRDADNPREAREARREYDRNLREANRNTRSWHRYSNYDWDRYEPGRNRYDADRYYRSGNYYQTRTLAYDDRVYRGQNGRYYCRRSDGTTGLIIGAAAGGLIGNTIVRGDSKTLGTVIGAAGGALVGREIERNNVRCR